MRPDEVLVWRASLLARPHEVFELFGLLDDDEQERARKFGVERERRRYVAGRVALRRVLGGALGVEAKEVRFSTGPFGKPALDPGFAAAHDAKGARALRFNASRSEDLFVCALTRAGEIGADVEWLGRELDFAALLPDVCADCDRAALARVAEAERREAVFRAWTRAESALKALGLGFSAAPGTLCAVCERDVVVSTVRREGDASGAAEVRRWHVRTFSPREGFLASVATEHPIRELLAFDL